MKSESRHGMHPLWTATDKTVRTKGPVLWDKTVVRQLPGFPCTRIMRPVRATAVGVRDRSIGGIENSASPEYRGSLSDCSREKDVHANFIFILVIDRHDSPVRLPLLWMDRKLRRRD